MKLYYLSVFSLFLLACNSNQNANTQAEPKKDTVFIEKNDRQSIYIDNNPNSQNHAKLADFKFTENDKKVFEASYAALKQANIPIKKFKMNDLPKEWLNLFPYKDRYFLYLPSDLGNIRRTIITDSLLVFWGAEGPKDLYALTSVKQISEQKCEIKAKNANGQTQNITVNRFERKKSLTVAIFENNGAKGEEKYMGMFVGRESVGSYDVIVNDSKGKKVAEYEFKDKIDFQKFK